MALVALVSRAAGGEFSATRVYRARTGRQRYGRQGPHPPRRLHAVPKVDIAAIKDANYNLDQKNPHAGPW